VQIISRIELDILGTPFGSMELNCEFDPDFAIYVML